MTEPVRSGNQVLIRADIASIQGMYRDATIVGVESSGNYIVQGTDFHGNPVTYSFSRDQIEIIQATPEAIHEIDFGLQQTGSPIVTGTLYGSNPVVQPTPTEEALGMSLPPNIRNLSVEDARNALGIAPPTYTSPNPPSLSVVPYYQPNPFQEVFAQNNPVSVQPQSQTETFVQNTGIQPNISVIGTSTIQQPNQDQLTIQYVAQGEQNMIQTVEQLNKQNRASLPVELQGFAGLGYGALGGLVYPGILAKQIAIGETTPGQVLSNTISYAVSDPYNFGLETTGALLAGKVIEPIIPKMGISEKVSYYISREPTISQSGSLSNARSVFDISSMESTGTAEGRVITNVQSSRWFGLGTKTDVFTSDIKLESISRPLVLDDLGQPLSGTVKLRGTIETAGKQSSNMGLGAGGNIIFNQPDVGMATIDIVGQTSKLSGQGTDFAGRFVSKTRPLILEEGSNKPILDLEGTLGISAVGKGKPMASGLAGLSNVERIEFQKFPEVTPSFIAPGKGSNLKWATTERPDLSIGLEMSKGVIAEDIRTLYPGKSISTQLDMGKISYYGTPTVGLEQFEEFNVPSRKVNIFVNPRNNQYNIPKQNVGMVPKQNMNMFTPQRQDQVFIQRTGQRDILGTKQIQGTAQRQSQSQRDDLGLGLRTIIGQDSRQFQRQDQLFIPSITFVQKTRPPPPPIPQIPIISSPGNSPFGFGDIGFNRRQSKVYSFQAPKQTRQYSPTLIARTFGISQPKGSRSQTTFGEIRPILTTRRRRR